MKMYWRRLIERLVRITPGLGHSDEANAAELRSKEMLTDARFVYAQVSGEAQFLTEIRRTNHFRDRVAEVLTARRPTS